MKRTDFSFETTDSMRISAHKWESAVTNDVKAVIQLSHGMAEHILRYEPFCQFLVQNGYIVYGNDHRGHGHSIVAPDDKGFFADKNGFEKVVIDMHTLSMKVKKEHPNVPLIIFGHSMGSFLTRRYVQLFGDEVDGIILSGTGYSQGLLGKIGLLIAKLERRRKGARTPSPLMNKLTFGSFNKKFTPVRTEFDFLSRDQQTVDAYIADENCGFICSSGFYVDLIRGIETIHSSSEMNRTPKDLPIFFISGDMDPVGKEGKGVQKVYEQYLEHDFTNVSIKLYPNARHELLNETNKEEVYDDIVAWIHAILSR